ncbi:regulator [Homoserinibacter sp. GY 40078]|uniref:AAA family ATPase n=1 Tax=Homoserinibacter sp. GY 40078 TaxID=2603275 RepID=UPI00164FAD46|nr:regulator [Homoserinibacter sp. GY 40078]
MRVALALAAHDAQALTETAEYHGHEIVASGGGPDLAVRLAEVGADVALVAATRGLLTAELIEATDLLGVRLVVVADDPDARRFAEVLGIIDAVDGPPSWDLLAASRVAAAPEARALVHRDVRPPDRRPPDAAEPLTTPSRGCLMVAVWGTHGAPGRTTIAIALAAEFAAGGRRVILADADTHAASLAPALGLLDEAPGFAAACRLAGLGSLDAAQLDRLGRPHPAMRRPFRVLTGISRASRWPELGPERVRGVVEAIRAVCDVLVVDVAASIERGDDDPHPAVPDGPLRDGTALEVLALADRVVVVGAADPIGIARLVRGLAELSDIVPRERRVVVANKVRASVIGSDAGAQVRRTLARLSGVERCQLIPWDPSACDAALREGLPLPEVAPRSPARQAIRAIAAELAPDPQAAPGGRRRGRRRLA